MTAVYWKIERRIVKSVQGGAVLANYGDELIKQLANDLSIHICGVTRFAISLYSNSLKKTMIKAYDRTPANWLS